MRSPIGLVKHAADRTLIADSSSNGKGTRTTLPLVMKRFPIGQCVDVLFRLFQEIEGQLAHYSLKPLLLIYVWLFRDQDDDMGSTGADNRQGFVQMQSSLFIDCPLYVKRFQNHSH